MRVAVHPRHLVSTLVIAPATTSWGLAATPRAAALQRSFLSLEAAATDEVERATSTKGVDDFANRSTAVAATMAPAVVTTVSASPAAKAGGKPKTTFYRRPLSLPCVAFSSVDGRRLFREALVEGYMESYFRLAEQFRTQDDPAFCGLSTLTMVLNALAVDPGRTWKGPWRWYHESMLDCCAPLDVVREKGVTLDTLACLSRCNGLEVALGTPNTNTIEDLRSVIETCCSEDLGKVVVVSYDRRGLKQTGSGHFSPVGGYHKAEDLVLIMDTARFKLPPHWVPLSMLWEAMKTIDPETGNPRGFMVLEKKHNLSHRLFMAAPGNYRDWPQVASWVKEMLDLASKEVTASADGTNGVDEKTKEMLEATNVAEFVSPLLARMPPVVHDLLTTFNSTGCSCSGQAQDGLVLQAIQCTKAYQEVARIERYSACGTVTPPKLVSTSSGVHGQAAATATSTTGNNKASAATVALEQLKAMCPDGSSTGCGCSSRHMLAIVTYSMLGLLHKRVVGKSTSGDGGVLAAAAPGGEHGELPSRLWSVDPLVGLPKPVVDEARHVGSILEGLVDMKKADVMQYSPPEQEQEERQNLSTMNII